MSPPAADDALFSLAAAAAHDQRLRRDPDVGGGASAAAPGSPAVPRQLLGGHGRRAGADPASADGLGRLSAASVDAAVV